MYTHFSYESPHRVLCMQPWSDALLNDVYFKPQMTDLWSISGGKENQSHVSVKANTHSQQLECPHNIFMV